MGVGGGVGMVGVVGAQRQQTPLCCSYKLEWALILHQIFKQVWVGIEGEVGH